MNAADVDKYATLFTPSTPRASPLLGPTAIDNDPPPIPYVRQRADSDDFGAFVSVPSTADPLAAGFFGEDDHPTQLENKRHDCDTTAAQPSTLQFFDQVGRDARAATDLKRKSFLDELLLHQDDPMYFLEAQSQDPEQDVKQAATTEHDPADLDQNFFQPPPARAETITVNSSPKMPMKMPMLAPPLTSSPDIMTPDPLDDPESSSSPDHPSPPQRSSSYTSISALPSKWMNSLLRGQQLPTAKPSLESIFSDLVIPSGAPSLRKKSSSGILDFPELSGSHHARSSSHPPSAENQSRSPAAFASLPNPSQHYRPRQVQITHSTPFTPPNNIVGGGYVYIPPAGAPGFKGEDHDWDKGFSNELEKERLSEVENALGQPPIDTGRLNYTEQADREEERTKARISTPTMKPPGIEGVGAFIEKKVGGLELVGRKASTIPILNVELGLQIRSYLPALSRLPKAWKLVYSTDQHGSSLNTLYSLCEAYSKPSSSSSLVLKRSCIVVVRDAGDAVFGAWLGEGILRDKGKGYFGSGESFLWRLKDGSLHVYKTTGRNNYITLCDSDYIAFGGGDGTYGLYLDETLFEGSSAPCPTFANEVLCSPGPRKAGRTVEFECMGLEVWGTS